MASAGTPGRSGGARDEGFLSSRNLRVSSLRRKALPGTFPGAKRSMTEGELLRFYRRMDGLPLEEREERARKLSQLDKMKAQYRRYMMLAPVVMCLGIGILALLNPHLGMSRSGTLYSEEVTTWRFPNATRCIPEDTCPFVQRATTLQARYLYRNPTTRTYDRVVVTSPSPVPAGMEPVTLFVYTRPCDQPFDESLAAFASLMLLHSICLPLVALDVMRQYRQFLQHLHEPEIAPEPGHVRVAKKILRWLNPAYGLVFFIIFAQIGQSTSCQYDVPNLYYMTLLTEGAFAAAATGAMVMALYWSVEYFSQVEATLWITVVSLVQTLMPLAQFIWPTTHSMCIIRDPPYLEYAPLCRAGVFVAGVFVAIGMFSILATHMLPAHRKPKALRIYVRLSTLSAVANTALAVPFLVAMSGLYREQYLSRNTRYCPMDGSTTVEGTVECVRSGILPWGWASNCWKDTTAEPYSVWDQGFSCKLCHETSTCADSDPPEKYLNDQRRTTLATVGYVLLALLSTFAVIIARNLRALMAADVELQRRHARRGLLVALGDTDGVRPLEVLLRHQRFGGYPFWDEAVEAEWQHQHNASDGEMWRLRIKRSEAWQTMRKLYDEVEFQAAAAEVFSEYLAFCEDHGEELLRLYNQGDAKLEGVKSADESGASASSAATTTEGAPTDGAATDTDASDTDAEDSSSDEVTSEVDKKSAAATKVTSPARAVPAAAAAKKKRPASSTKLSSARVRWRMSGSSADSETSASDDDDVLQHATASRAQVRTFN